MQILAQPYQTEQTALSEDIAHQSPLTRNLCRMTPCEHVID